jgi:low affinity Fe/Cu permease
MVEKINERFGEFARWASGVAGSAGTFCLAIALIVGWALSGPFFHYSDTWQLVINTSTTIVTFLMVFLIQNAQNRDARAIHLKLDELIRAKQGARNSLIDLESLSDEQLAKLQNEFNLIRADDNRDRRIAAERAAKQTD